MSFTDSIKICFAKYADFTGRAKRPEYWWFALFGFIASLPLNFVSHYLSWAFSFAVLLPSLAVGSWHTQITRHEQKRLDAIDLDYSCVRLDLHDLPARTAW